MEEDNADKKRSHWIADAKDDATCFRRRRVLKNCFSRWKRRLMEQVEYLEAVEKSKECSKQRELSSSVSVSSSGGDRKRRVSGISPDAAQRKRVRKRQSITYTHSRTDDDLVKTLQEVSAIWIAFKLLLVNSPSCFAEPRRERTSLGSGNIYNIPP